MAVSDQRLADLMGDDNKALWNMVYDSVFTAAFAEVALNNATFFSHFSSVDALDYLKDQLRKNVRQLLREKRNMVVSI